MCVLLSRCKDIGGGDGRASAVARAFWKSAIGVVHIFCCMSSFDGGMNACGGRSVGKNSPHTARMFINIVRASSGLCMW
jgi:hypothetical protein